MAETKAKKVAKGKIEHDDQKHEKAHALTVDEVKKAKRTELVEYLEEHGMDTEGKVEELRERMLEHMEKHPPKAAKKEKAKSAKAMKEGDEETIDIQEEGAYVPKKKPADKEGVRAALLLRKKLAVTRPTFLRQEWFRYKRLGLKWRRPQGGQSALRRHFKYRINVVSIGYRGPVKSRGMHPSGFFEVLVHNTKELEGVEPATHAVRIAHGVGMRKRKQIEEAADTKGLRVLNRSGASES